MTQEARKTTDHNGILKRVEARADVERLAPWFHNLHLPDGTQTAPDHALGDFPAFKWQQISAHVPDDLGGWKVLDVGCNAGFYSFELARRGGHVTAIDVNAHYLRQAKWAARQYRLEQSITFRQMQLYALAREPEVYDLVWFMGVSYHLRYPLLALDILRRKVRKMMVFQSMTMPGDDVLTAPDDLDLFERELMQEPGWPKMAFIEHRLAGDPTNWWAPNHACVEALLRASGFCIIGQPTEETYLCVPDNDPLDYARMRNNELDAVIVGVSGESGA